MLASLQRDLTGTDIKVIRVSTCPEQVGRIEYLFEGDRKEFIDGLKALKVSAVLLLSVELPDDFYMYDLGEDIVEEVLGDSGSDDDEGSEMETNQIDLREVSPKLRQYESYIGKTYAQMVSAPIGPVILTYREEEDWTAGYDDTMDRAREKAIERVRARIQQRHQSAKDRESKIEAELNRLYETPAFLELLRASPNKVPLRSLVIAAQKQSKELEDVSEIRLRRPLQELRARAKSE